MDHSDPQCIHWIRDGVLVLYPVYCTHTGPALLKAVAVTGEDVGGGLNTTICLPPPQVWSDVSVLGYVSVSVCARVSVFVME